MSDKKVNIKEILSSLAKAMEKHGLKEAAGEIKDMESVVRDPLTNLMSRTPRTTGLPGSQPYGTGGGPGGAEEEYVKDVGFVPKGSVNIQGIGPVPKEMALVIQYALQKYPKEYHEKLKETLKTGIGTPLSAAGAKSTYERVPGVGIVETDKIPVVQFAQQLKPSNPEETGYKSKLLNIFKTGLHPERAKYAYCARHLQLLSEQVKEKGYAKLGERLASISLDFFWKSAGEEDFHKIPSIEEIYQRGQKHEHFEQDLKKLIGAYQNIVGILKAFEKSYKDTVMEDIEKEHKDVDALAKKTVELVRKTDHFVYSEISKV